MLQRCPALAVIAVRHFLQQPDELAAFGGRQGGKHAVLRRFGGGNRIVNQPFAVGGDRHRFRAPVFFRHAAGDQTPLFEVFHDDADRRPVEREAPAETDLVFRPALQQCRENGELKRRQIVAAAFVEKDRNRDLLTPAQQMARRGPQVVENIAVGDSHRILTRHRHQAPMSDALWP